MKAFRALQNCFIRFSGPTVTIVVFCLLLFRPAAGSATCGQVEGFDPSSLGPLEKDPVVEKAHFQEIVPYLTAREFDKAVDLIQQIINSHPNEPKVLIVGYFRLYETLGSSGVMERESDKRLDYFEKSLKALEKFEELIRSQPTTEQQTTYKNILATTLPVAYTEIYSRRSMRSDTREADMTKVLDTSRELIKRNPDAPVALWVLNSFDSALSALYKSPEYEKQLKALIEEFSKTSLEEPLRQKLAWHYLREVNQSTKDLCRTLDSWIERHGRSPNVDLLLDQHKKIVEQLFQKYESGQSVRGQDKSTFSAAGEKQAGATCGGGSGCTCGSTCTCGGSVAAPAASSCCAAPSPTPKAK